jgi:hypothetical protein
MIAMEQKTSLLISHRELMKLVLLIGLAIVVGSLLYDYLHRAAKVPALPNLAAAEDIRPLSRMTPQPFIPDATALSAIADDPYLKTAPFYYLVHRMMSSSHEQIGKEVNPALTWDALKQVERRAAWRGQTMRVRGSLLRLRRQTMEGKDAEARGLNGGDIWEAAIYNVRGYIIMCMIAELPPVIHKDDEIEAVGAFLKVWEYPNAAGETSRAPVVIAKTLHVVTRRPANAPQYLIWPLLVVMTAIFLAILLTFWRDRHQQKALWQLIWKERRRCVKNR